MVPSSFMISQITPAGVSPASLAMSTARLAGLTPAGVICEIMNDDGTMARRDDLIAFAQRHGLKVGTIADLIAYRLRHDRIVERIVESTLQSEHGGEWRMLIYKNQVQYAEHIALLKGDISGDEPVLVRMHALNVLPDVLGDRAEGKADELHRAMDMIAERGRGIVVVIREPMPTSLSDRVRRRMDHEPQKSPELRDYGVGAQTLLDLGVRQMVLLSNSQRTIVGLDGYGLSVVDRLPIRGAKS